MKIRGGALIEKSKFRILDFLMFFADPPPFGLFPLFVTFFNSNAEHLLWSEFSEMVRIRTILQISVRIRSEFAQKVRFFQFLSLSLPKNLEKEALV